MTKTIMELWIFMEYNCNIMFKEKLFKLVQKFEELVETITNILLG